MLPRMGSHMNFCSQVRVPSRGEGLKTELMSSMVMQHHFQGHGLCTPRRPKSDFLYLPTAGPSEMNCWPGKTIFTDRNSETQSLGLWSLVAQQPWPTGGGRGQGQCGHRNQSPFQPYLKRETDILRIQGTLPCSFHVGGFHCSF